MEKGYYKETSVNSDFHHSGMPTFTTNPPIAATSKSIINLGIVLMLVTGLRWPSSLLCPSRSPSTSIHCTLIWPLISSALLPLRTVAAEGESTTNEADCDLTFAVDWEKNQLLKNGEPFRFIGGSFHYFRAHSYTWQRKLHTLRAAGLNVVTTYVEWFTHNPYNGVYLWEKTANITHFLDLAVEEDLLVILRVGPYICAEREFGGLPYWLMTLYPNIKLRTSDPDYIREVGKWFKVLMPKIVPYLYGNGGPVIMVQMENEYGSYDACDHTYLNWLRDELMSYIQDKAVLFTNDGPSNLKCGYTESVLATLDFGATDNIDDNWNKLRQYQPKGPLVNMEFYVGWLTHWGEPMVNRSVDSFLPTLKELLDKNVNVNLYMFYGGTNFGFTNGANLEKSIYKPQITSYDYNAPMDEAGNPTEKYHAIRKLVLEYLPEPKSPVPEPVKAKSYGPLHLESCCSMFSAEGRKWLALDFIRSRVPLHFEALNQSSGFVLYETWIPSKLQRNRSIIGLVDLRDTAYVYVDELLIGILSREAPWHDIPAHLRPGQKLQILVESEGRINYGEIFEHKGVSEIELNYVKLTNWNITLFPLRWYPDVDYFIVNEAHKVKNTYPTDHGGLMILHNGPRVYYSILEVDELADTYLDTTGWGKGIAFVNGNHLGRYWPIAGPQITLYVPQEFLRKGENRIVLIEYRQPAYPAVIHFVDTPIFRY